MISYGHLSDFLKSDFLFHVHFSVVICGFLVESSQITIVLMHVSFKIQYRNNLIDKKHSYLIPRPPSWDDRNCSYGHQLYHSDSYCPVMNIITNNYRHNGRVCSFLIKRNWVTSQFYLLIMEIDTYSLELLRANYFSYSE